MRYKTVIELITDADNENEAIDKAGEYLRGADECGYPLKIRACPMNKRNYRALGYSIATCFIVLSLSYMWFAAGCKYQTLTSERSGNVEKYAINPPLNTDATHESGRNFKKSWDRLYKEKVLYSPDENIKAK